MILPPRTASGRIMAVQDGPAEPCGVVPIMRAELNMCGWKAVPRDRVLDTNTREAKAMDYALHASHGRWRSSLAREYDTSLGHSITVPVRR